MLAAPLSTALATTTNQVSHTLPSDLLGFLTAMFLVLLAALVFGLGYMIGKTQGIREAGGDENEFDHHIHDGHEVTHREEDVVEPEVVESPDTDDDEAVVEKRGSHAIRTIHTDEARSLDDDLDSQRK